MAGCDYVLHVASPFPPKQPRDPDELIVPAREGTLRVLRAALDAGVKRVVVTSSIAAIRLAKGAQARTLTESDWTDPDADGLTPYVRSKAIAERAAWDLASASGAEDRVAVVNPGVIIGPVLNDDLSYSLETVQRMLAGMPGVPARVQPGRRARRGRARARSDDFTGSGRRALHRGDGVSLDG